MKKITIALTSVIAAAAFAPEASALPAFARQTGMACAGCHQTHFPILNGFGRAFKASGYVMMGAQGQIEGDHLSIPETLNAAFLLKYRAQHDTNVVVSAGEGVTQATSAAEWQPQMGDEYSLFFGGRVADTGNLTIGFLNENNNVAGGVAGLRVPINYDLGAAKVTVVPFTTDALGVAYSFELSSGGVMRANRWAEHRRETSAIQYNADRGADGGAAAGTALVVQNDMGFINYTKWSSSFAPGANGGAVPSTSFGQTYIRVAATPTVGGWDMVVGAGQESGSSFGNLAGNKIESNQTFYDLQAHGEVAGMMTGFYLQHAKAPVCDSSVNTAAVTAATADTIDADGNLVAGAVVAEAIKGCAHNTGSVERRATTIGAEFQVVEHVLNLGLAYRMAQNGSKITGTNEAQTDNAVTFTALYDIAQNVALVANFSQYSGTAYTGPGSKQLTTLMLEAAW